MDTDNELNLEIDDSQDHSNSSSASITNDTAVNAEEIPRMDWQSPIVPSSAVHVPDQESNVVCAACSDGTVYLNNEILYCDKCNVAVHQTCYGISKIPSGSWFCYVCASGGDPFTTVCELCSNFGGAYKPTNKPNKWVYALCATWIPEVYLMDSLGTSVSLSRVDMKRYRLKCRSCSSKGACIQCCHGRCTTAAHPWCVMHNAKGFTHRVVNKKENAHVKWEIYCKTHASEVKSSKAEAKGKPKPKVRSSSSSSSSTAFVATKHEADELESPSLPWPWSDRSASGSSGDRRGGGGGGGGAAAAARRRSGRLAKPITTHAAACSAQTELETLVARLRQNQEDGGALCSREQATEWLHDIASLPDHAMLDCCGACELIVSVLGRHGHDDVPVVEQAFLAINHMLLSEANKAMFERCGMTDVLLALLEQHSRASGVVVEEGLRAIATLSANGAQCRGLPLVIALLNQLGEHIDTSIIAAEQALCALANFISNDSTITTKQELIWPIVLVLKGQCLHQDHGDSSKRIFAVGMRSLANIFTTSDEINYDHHCAALLICMMNKYDDDVSATAAEDRLRIIAKLSANSTCRWELERNGALIVNLLMHRHGNGNIVIVEQGLIAISNLYSIHCSTKLSVVDACELVVSSLKQYGQSNMSIAEKGLEAVARLSGRGGISEEFASDGVCEIVLSLLKHIKISLKMVQDGFQAIRNLSCHDIHKMTLNTCGAGDLLSSLMKVHGGTNAALVTCVREALQNLQFVFSPVLLDNDWRVDIDKILPLLDCFETISAEKATETRYWLYEQLQTTRRDAERGEFKAVHMLVLMALHGILNRTGSNSSPRLPKLCMKLLLKASSQDLEDGVRILQDHSSSAHDEFQYVKIILESIANYIALRLKHICAESYNVSVLLTFVDQLQNQFVDGFQNWGFNYRVKLIKVIGKDLVVHRHEQESFLRAIDDSATNDIIINIVNEWLDGARMSVYNQQKLDLIIALMFRSGRNHAVCMHEGFWKCPRLIGSVFNMSTITGTERHGINDIPPTTRHKIYSTEAVVHYMQNGLHYQVMASYIIANEDHVCHVVIMERDIEQGTANAVQADLARTSMMILNCNNGKLPLRIVGGVLRQMPETSQRMIGNFLPPFRNVIGVFQEDDMDHLQGRIEAFHSNILENAVRHKRHWTGVVLNSEQLHDLARSAICAIRQNQCYTPTTNEVIQALSSSSTANTMIDCQSLWDAFIQLQDNLIEALPAGVVTSREYARHLDNSEAVRRCAMAFDPSQSHEMSTAPAKRQGDYGDARMLFKYPRISQGEIVDDHETVDYNQEDFECDYDMEEEEVNAGYHPAVKITQLKRSLRDLWDHGHHEQDDANSSDSDSDNDNFNDICSVTDSDNKHEGSSNNVHVNVNDHNIQNTKSRENSVHNSHSRSTSSVGNNRQLCTSSSHQFHSSSRAASDAASPITQDVAPSIQIVTHTPQALALGGSTTAATTDEHDLRAEIARLQKVVHDQQTTIKTLVKMIPG